MAIVAASATLPRASRAAIVSSTPIASEHTTPTDVPPARQLPRCATRRTILVRAGHQAGLHRRGPAAQLARQRTPNAFARSVTGLTQVAADDVGTCAGRGLAPGSIPRQKAAARRGAHGRGRLARREVEPRSPYG